MNITISRIIDSPRESVFEAWTKPANIKKWWGPVGFTAPHIEVDLRKGGKYLYCMKGPDGTKYWSAGVFLEVDKSKKVVVIDYFSDDIGRKIDPAKVFGATDMPKESIVEVTFEDMLGKTRLTILYDNLTAVQKKAMMKVQMLEGWKTSLDKLEKYVKRK